MNLKSYYICPKLFTNCLLVELNETLFLKRSFTKTKTSHKKKNNFIKFNIHSKNIYLVYTSLNFNFQFEIFMEIKIPVHFCIKKKMNQSINNNNKLP